MPATRQALRLEDEYGRRVGRLWRRVARTVLAQFDGLDSANLRSAFATFVAGATATVELGQLEAQRLAAAFVEQYVEVEASRAFRAAPTGDGITGTTRAGDSLRLALTGATGMAWRALGTGRPVGMALAIARAQVARTVSQAVSSAADRELEHQAERQPVLMTGWERVPAGDACIACLADTGGDPRPWSESMLEHPHGDCVRSPVLVGVPERVARPTGDELFRGLSRAQQEATFRHAGAEKAALIRAGEASLADFVVRDRTAAGTVITEAPLEAVA